MKPKTVHVHEFNRINCFCGNEIGHAAKCADCGRAVGYCPEHGGFKRAQAEIASHEAGHAPEAKRATCRWCDWTSEPYAPGDEWARDEAFKQQRRHVSGKHRSEFNKIRAAQRVVDKFC